MLFDPSIIAEATQASPKDLTAAIIANPLIVPPDMMVVDAIAQMGRMNATCETGLHKALERSVATVDNRSSCVLVVSGKSVIGILTERDVVRLSIRQNSLQGITMQQVMTSPVMTLRQSEMTDLFSVIDVLKQYRIRHLPIMDDRDNLIGIVTHESLRAISRPISLLRLRQVSEVMTVNVVYATPEASILDVAQQMIDHQVSSIVMVEPRIQSSPPSVTDEASLSEEYRNSEEKPISPATTVQLIPIGILTERDLVQFQTLGLQPSAHHAQAMMSTPVFSIDPNASLWVAQHLMDQHLINRVVVTGKEGELLGIVTQTSVLQALNSPELYKLAELLEARVETLEAEKISLLQRQAQDLAKQVSARTHELEAKAKREQVLTDLCAQIRSSLSLSTILSTTVEQIHSHLGCDRVNIWQFDDAGQAIVVAEATDSPYSLIGQQIDLSTLQTPIDHDVTPQPIRPQDLGGQDIGVSTSGPPSPDLEGVSTDPFLAPALYRNTLSMWEREHLLHLQTPEKILVPLFCGEQLWGLLNVSENLHHRTWEPQDVELLQALSIHLAIALQQATAHEKLQQELEERRQAEARQKVSEQRYESLAAAVPVGIFRTDRTGCCTYVNERYCQMTRLLPEEAIGECWEQCLHPDDRDRVMTEWYRTVQENQESQIEYRLCLTNGTIVWVYGQMAKEYDADGNLMGYVGTITDISERKQLELERHKAEENLQKLNQTLELKVQERTAALEKREARYRALVEVIPDLLIRIRADGTYLDVVVGHATPLFNPQQFKPGANIYEVTPSDHAQTRMAYVQQALQTREPQFYEYELRVNNQLIIAEARIIAINDDEALIIVRDISDRKQAELQLQELIEGTAATTGQDFFPALVEHIAIALDVTHAIVCERVEDQLSFLALWINGMLQSPISLPVSHTPCEQTLTHGYYYAEHSVQDLFPNVPELAEMGVSSYLGVVLTNTTGTPIGTLCILHTERLSNPKQSETLLRVFAARAAAELERQRAIASLETMNHQLEAKVLQRTAALQERETRYRALMEGAGDGILLLQRNGQILEANPKAEELLGYSCAELATMHHSQLHPPEEMEKILAGFESMEHQPSNQATQSIQLLDIVFLQPDGTNIPVDISAALITINGEPMIQEILRDIRERKRMDAERTKAQAAIAESEARFRYLADYAPVLIWLSDQNKLFTHFNKGWLAFTGRPLEEELGNGWVQGVHPEELQFCIDTYTSAFDARQPFEMEYRLRRWDGEYRWILDVGIPRHNANGDFLGYIGSCIDISDRKQAEAQLRQTNAELARATRLKDEFLANMSHELRTPLNAILGMTEGLTEQIFGPVNIKQSQALTTIERSGTHLLSLINDILDVAKIESGQVELDYNTVTVAYLCRSSLTFIKQQAQKKGIQLTTHLPPGLPNLSVDERRLRQVLINLLNNAVKFTPEGGSVTLSASQHFTVGPGIAPKSSNPSYGESSNQKSFPYLNAMHQWSAPDPSGPPPQPYLHISITDTGIGIEPEHLTRLFKPFVQIDSALNRQYAGTGLGLALVKHIVTLHGGQVKVTSEVGHGSCFTVILPCSTLASAKDSANPPTFSPSRQRLDDETPSSPSQITDSYQSGGPSCSAPPVLASPLILLAEDNMANVRTVSSYLEAKGYRLIVANDGQEAVSLAQSESPDVVLMDIQMPGMDGLEAIQQLRQDADAHTLPIIALTALTMEGDRDRCLAAGANDYLSKPIRLKQLTTLIQQYVQRPS